MQHWHVVWRREYQDRRIDYFSFYFQLLICFNFFQTHSPPLNYSFSAIIILLGIIKTSYHLRFSCCGFLTIPSIFFVFFFKRIILPKIAAAALATLIWDILLSFVRHVRDSSRPCPSSKSKVESLPLLRSLMFVFWIFSTSFSYTLYSSRDLVWVQYIHHSVSTPPSSRIFALRRLCSSPRRCRL